jgi:hypothetical protein
LKNVLAKKRYPYQTEPWAQALRARFDALPGDLGVELRLTDPASLILMHLFVEGLDEFRKQVSADKAREELLLPLYMILGRSQEIAKSLDRRQIDSRMIIPGAEQLVDVSLAILRLELIHRRRPSLARSVLEPGDPLRLTESEGGP